MLAHLRVNLTDNLEETPTISLLFQITCKVGGSEMEHVRVDLPFSYIQLNGNIFSPFFRERKIDEECNTSGFIFFGAFLN